MAPITEENASKTDPAGDPTREEDAPNHDVVDNLIALLRVEADRLSLQRTLKHYHAADIAEAIEDLTPDTKRLVMGSLDLDQTVQVLEEVTEEEASDYAEEATVEELARIVDVMSADDAADFLEHIDESKSRAVLAKADPTHAQAILALSSYPQESAGGIMTTEFFWAGPTDPVETVLGKLRTEYEELETIQQVFVLGPDMRLKGVVAVEDLIAASPAQPLAQLMDPATVTIGPGADQEVCARYMRKYDLSVLPVVDKHRRLLGIITLDDILGVVSQEAEEDMFRLAGVGSSRPLEQKTWQRAYQRVPWLLATLVGSGLISPVIVSHFFRPVLQQVVALAFFIPAIMGLAGNTAVQSSTIAVRGLATGELEFGDLWWMLRREMLVALIVGAVCSLALAGFSWGVGSLAFDRAAAGSLDWTFALTVGVSMFAATLFAVVLGTVIPLGCHRLKIDPAVAAGPFITTLIDIGSQVIYLSLGGAMLLHHHAG